MIHGKFITFEGPEGSGKSTHIRYLADHIISIGHTPLLTREPGGTRTGEAIRRLLQHESTDEEMSARTEILLFEASRAQIVDQVIAPALQRGEYVLCDRFYDSTLAYQGYGRGLPLTQLNVLNMFATNELSPDLTFLLDVSVEEGLRRIKARPGNLDRMERAEKEFHERVRNGYLELARQNPERFAIINTEMGPDEVKQKIIETLHTRLKFT